MKIAHDKAWLQSLIGTYFEQMRMQYPLAFHAPAKRLENLGAEDGGVPAAMEDGEIDAEGWVAWKLLPSAVTTADLDALEDEFGLAFPPLLRAFLSTYYHLFGEGVGEQPCDNPFRSLQNSYHPLLAACGYLPFAWDPQYAYIRCIDLEKMPDEDRCPVVQIDHEQLFDLREQEATPQDLQRYMQPVSDNLRAYLQMVFSI